MANYSGEGPVCHVCPAKGMLPGRNVVSASFVRQTLFSPDENRNDLLRFRKKSLTWHRMNTGFIKNQRIWGTVIRIPLTMPARKA